MPDKICIICNSNIAIYDEILCLDCAAGAGITDELSARNTYPILFREGLGIFKCLAAHIRNGEAPRGTGIATQTHSVAIAPTVGYYTAIKFLYFTRLMRRVADIGGDIVECGVGWGESMMHMLTVASSEQPLRKFWGFDSFSGWPKPTDNDKSVRNTVEGDLYSAGEIGTNPIDVLYDTYILFGFPSAWLATHLTLVRGWFSDSLSAYAGHSVAMLHLDCDLYESYKLCLEKFYPLVRVGGIIAVDEYANTKEQLYFPGARKAIDEYLFDKPVRRERDEYNGKYCFVKEG